MRSKRRMHQSYDLFRYYPIYQKRIEIKNNYGVVNDYKTVNYLPSSLDRSSVIELTSDYEKRIVGNKIIVKSRVPEFDIKNGDRLFYFSKIANYNNVLRISTFKDKTNRGEYLELHCIENALTNESSIDNNKIVFKITQNSIFDLSNLIINQDAIKTLENFKLNGHFDTFNELIGLDYLIQDNDLNTLFYIISKNDITIEKITNFTKARNLQISDLTDNTFSVENIQILTRFLDSNFVLMINQT